MDFQDMRIELNKDKKIGKVLFIVEGSRTEPYIMTKLFTSILDYQLETKLREKKVINSTIQKSIRILRYLLSMLSRAIFDSSRRMMDT